MKKFLKELPYIIISTVSCAIITIMDLVLLLMTLFIKTMRLIFCWLCDAFTPDDAFNNEAVGNLFINYGYKYYIDLLYPVEEDYEEDDEDEES